MCNTTNISIYKYAVQVTDVCFAVVDLFFCLRVANVERDAAALGSGFFVAAVAHDAHSAEAGVGANVVLLGDHVSL